MKARTIKAQVDMKATEMDQRGTVSTVYITETLLTDTAELLASFSKGRRAEGIVYWFGFEFGRNSIVTTLIVPDADTSGGCIATSEEANAEAVAAIYGTPLVLLGQAHSHPRSLIRHSDVDNRDTFARFDGAISVVVPHYARKGIRLAECGVHRHLGGHFTLIDPEDADRHLKVIPGLRDLRRTRSQDGDKNKGKRKWFSLT
jgi:proteasome lid subunit RPN8/RPN11